MLMANYNEAVYGCYMQNAAADLLDGAFGRGPAFLACAKRDATLQGTPTYQAQVSGKSQHWDAAKFKKWRSH
jgi:hypothetical protein